MTKNYNLKYELNIDTNNLLGFNQGDVEKITDDSKMAGAADGFFFVTMIRRLIDKNLFIEIDSTILGVSAEEEFCIWESLAKDLLAHPDLPDFMKEICENAVKQFDELNQENRIVHELKTKH